MRKVQVTCVCSHGKNRSRYLKEYLERIGTPAHAVGINQKSTSTDRRIRDAKVVISVHPDFEAILEERFDLSDKIYIKLDVDDQPADGKQTTGESWMQYQREYVYPALEKQLKKHMPFAI